MADRTMTDDIRRRAKRSPYRIAPRAVCAACGTVTLTDQPGVVECGECGAPAHAAVGFYRTPRQDDDEQAPEGPGGDAA